MTRRRKFLEQSFPPKMNCRQVSTCSPALQRCDAPASVDDVVVAAADAGGVRLE